MSPVSDGESRLSNGNVMWNLPKDPNAYMGRREPASLLMLSIVEICDC